MTPWYACIHLREFPAQALLRAQPSQRPTVILEGKPPLERVCSLNRAAAAMGLEPGMTKVEVESFAAVNVLRRCQTTEAKTKALLLNCIAEFTPQVEWAECADTECAAVMDLGGSQMLFGSPRAIATRVSRQLRALNLITQIGISQNFHAAVLLARAAPGIRMAEANEEASQLTSLSTVLLPMDDQQRETLATWGIERLGELAALPEKELISRMGQAGRRLRQLARGEHPHHFQPIEAPFLLEERMELDETVEQMESLLFCLSPMLERVIADARDRALAIATLNIVAGLEGGLAYKRTLRPALATCDRALLLKLLQLDMAAHPPEAGVRTLEVTAEAGPTSKVQLGLFAPQLPEPGRLQVTLARIAALVGEQRVGWAKLEDTYREDASTIQPFVVGEAPRTLTEPVSCSAIRRLRPPAVIAPRIADRRPRWFLYAGKPYTVARSFGPWQRSGAWWSGEIWSVEHWDVVAYSPAEELLLCILANDRIRGSWHLEAVYD